VYKTVSSRDIRVQQIDLAAGRLVGPPATFAEGFVPGPQDPNWSADGITLAYQACRGLGSCLVIRNIETGEVRRLSSRQVGYTRDPRWSPDGSSLLIGGRDPKGRDGIFRLDIKTGTVTALAYRPNLGSSPRWSADGSRIYFDSRDERRRIVERDLRSGAERDVFVGVVRNFEVSPDGTRLALMTELDPTTRTARLLLVPVSDGPPRELMRFASQEFPPQMHSFSWTPDSQSILTARRSDGRAALWLVPIGEGQPRRLDISIDEWSVSDPDAFLDGGFALSPDGGRISYIVGQNTVEAWALENVRPHSAAR
jgi:Tol biopolymer transport system component